MTLVCAHRGASVAQPDNTIAAFAAAIDSGCDAIETDVRRAPGGGLVLAHDAPVPGDAVALDALVALARGRVGLDLELKERGLADDLLAAVAGFDGWLMVTSFDAEALGEVRARDASVALGLLVEAPEDDPFARARACGAGAVLAADALVDALLPAPGPLWSWTVDDRERIAALLDAGLAGVITDDPMLAMEVRCSKA